MSKLLLCLVTSAALILPTVASAEPTVLKLSFVTSDRSNIYQCEIKPFVDAINNDDPDQLRIEVDFGRGPSAALADQAELVLTGKADITGISVMRSPTLFPDSTALLLPGLFRDMPEASRVYGGLIEAGALAGYKDFVALGTFLSSGENIHSRNQIGSLAALRGQTIRVSNEIEAASLKMLGAVPVLLPINQTMERLGQGTVDGVTAPPVMLFEFGFGRITTNHYMLKLGAVPTFLAMSRAKFAGLPARAQEIIREHSGTRLSERAAVCMEEKGRETIAQLRADQRRKVVFPSQADQAAANRVFDQTIEEWAAQSPRNRELLNLVKAEVIKVRAGK